MVTGMVNPVKRYADPDEIYRRLLNDAHVLGVP